ncbi:MAG: response regulator [candidate division KSB1 bacterium]
MPRRILFVDDEDWSVEPYFDKLRDHQVEFDLALDGDQAIKFLQEKSYDLLVVDIMLPPGETIGPNIEPRKAGEVFLRNHRTGEIPRLKTSSQVSVVVVTAVTDHKLPETMKELEVKEVFQKPAPFDLVTDRILAWAQG